MRFAIVPETLINQDDPQRLLVYCRIYLLIVLRQPINCRAISKETGLSYGIVYRLKRLANEMLSNAVGKPNRKRVKTKRKHSNNTIRYNTEDHDMSHNEDDNNVKTDNNNLKSQRKANCYTPRNQSNLRLVLEEEEEIELELLSLDEILELPASERQRYIQLHQQQLKQQGIL